MSSRTRQRQPALDGLFACKQGVFWIEPYLQLGGGAGGKSYEIVWFSPFAGKFWHAQRRRSPSHHWENLDIERAGRVNMPSISFKQLVARLPVESDCAEQEYRLLVNGHPVFSSRYLSQSSRIAVFGDYADGRQGAANTARTVAGFDPSLIVLTGDLVYDHGRLSEYQRYFFPALNGVAVPSATECGAGGSYRTDYPWPPVLNEFTCEGAIGSPLLRSRPSVAALGNHDIGLIKTAALTPVNLECGKEARTVTFDPGRYDDLFAYFHIFRHPGNGPSVPFRLVKPGIMNDPRAVQLRARFGDRFLERTNFSFDWLNTHWLVVDANRYVDWTVPQLRAWLRRDLKSAVRADWKFVVFHQPPFNSDVKYWSEQRMRLVFDIFQEESVDLTFSGHCHYYERHRPIRFRPAVKRPAADGTVDGVFLIDRQFDGVSELRPRGVINVITGAGGQIVSEDHRKPRKLAESSLKLIDDRRSFTLLDVDGRRLTVRQVTDAGDEIDKFTIDKR